jgi:hypothetical protein
MIRREVDNQFLLITQEDHARLAGELARRLGDAWRAPDDVIAAIGAHDGGWKLHDAAPTVNREGLPLHVFETPAELSVRLWRASIQRGEALGARAQLLISLHALALSDMAAAGAARAAARNKSQRALFELNKFQHQEIERQAALRAKIGARMDVPLTLGLAARGASDVDDRLRFDLRLLRGMDRISLALLCAERPFSKVELPPHPGAPPAEHALEFMDDGALRVDPWIFDQRELRLEVRARAVPRRAYQDDAQLQSALAAAGPVAVECILKSSTRG